MRRELALVMGGTGGARASISPRVWAQVPSPQSAASGEPAAWPHVSVHAGVASIRACGEEAERTTSSMSKVAPLMTQDPSRPR